MELIYQCNRQILPYQNMHFYYKLRFAKINDINENLMEQNFKETIILSLLRNFVFFTDITVLGQNTWKENPKMETVFRRRLKLRLKETVDCQLSSGVDWRTRKSWSLIQLKKTRQKFWNRMEFGRGKRVGDSGVGTGRRVVGRGNRFYGFGNENKFRAGVKTEEGLSTFYRSQNFYLSDEKIPRKCF